LKIDKILHILGHHKIKILSLPFVFFIGFIIYSQLFGSVYLNQIEKVNYTLSSVGLLFILINYFIVKNSRILLIGTLALSVICLALSAFAFFKILVGAADGNKNIYILFVIPFTLFLVYAYYELFD